ncbi:major facilitator superfamily domain-containing protein 12-like isoform X2 [Anthonomus grandis grandis]|nr:major facilitator superfamily domain-containing protein 12-like isoform X2 [Anthonomus grandis grandis]XP_050301528.1 major facilitator superfamily domain-containing protein 12-like isoform X2 [Anthonomus grandis grandis]XP_050301529.1 major facilitator superfamily domain-containing protein 12-like isoform X2 [Anthonomus grandis grandis]
MEENYDYSEVYQRLSFCTYLAYGMGHILNDVCASMWFTYLLIFMHLVLDFTNTEAGTLILIGQVADALSTPFVGYYSDQGDNFWFCRYGKRKTWHLIGTICVIFTFPFIFSPCVGCQQSSHSAKMLYYGMFIIIFQFGWAAVQISHLSLIPEISPNEHDRTKLTAVRYAFTVMANIIVYMIAWLVLSLEDRDNSQIGPPDVGNFQLVVNSVMGLGVLCSLLFHIFVKENNVTNTGFQDVRGPRLRTDFKELFSNIQMYQGALNYMCSRLFINLTQVFITLYLHEVLQTEASALAVVPLVMYLGSLMTSLFIGTVTKMIGRKLAYIFGTMIGVAACILVHFGGKGPLYSYYIIYLVAALLGSASSIVLVSSLGVTTDLIGTRTDSGAFVFGLMSFVDKLSNGIVIAIIQSSHEGETNDWFYRDMLTYVCGGALLFGGLAVISLRRLISEAASNEQLLFDNEETEGPIN